MRLPKFEYYKPESLSRAFKLMEKNQGEIKIVAGGTDLLVNMKHKLVSPRYLMSLKGIKELNTISQNTDGVAIGSHVVLQRIEQDKLIIEKYSVLAQAAASVGGPAHRIMGTIGGNIALDTRCWYYNQSKSWRNSRKPCFKTGGAICYVAKKSDTCQALYMGDTAPALMVLDAKVKAISSSSSRLIPVKQLFTGDGNNPTVLAKNEIITEIILPNYEEDMITSTYLKFRVRQAVDFPILGVAASHIKSGNDSVIRIAVNGVAPKPALFEVMKTEYNSFDNEIAAEHLSKMVFEQIRPVHRMGGNPIYKRSVLKNLVKQSIEVILV